MDSILDSVKKTLNIDAAYLAFDPDIKMHINSVFADLHQLGIGPAEGFAIDDNVAVWGDFLDTDVTLNNVRSYMYLRVRLLFDPPTTSYHIVALNEQIQKFEWRINVNREEEAWTDPTTPSEEE